VSKTIVNCDLFFEWFVDGSLIVFLQHSTVDNVANWIFRPPDAIAIAVRRAVSARSKPTGAVGRRGAVANGAKKGKADEIVEMENGSCRSAPCSLLSAFDF